MISYRSADAAFANRVNDHLRARGVDTWIDREGIKPGMKWREELLQALRDCDSCVVVLSPSYLASEHCRMEVFVARSFGRLLLPIMIEECMQALRDHEETKGLEDIFMVLMHRRTAVGLPMTDAEGLRRITDAVVRPSALQSPDRAVYVSYARDADFATELANGLTAKGIPSWVETRDVRVGENWREAQVRAMMRATAHLVVLDEAIVDHHVLRTEILLSEARGLDTWPILPPRLVGQQQAITNMLAALNHSDETYRRLGATQYFSSAGGVDRLVEELAAPLTQRAMSIPGQRSHGN